MDRASESSRDRASDGGGAHSEDGASERGEDRAPVSSEGGANESSEGGASESSKDGWAAHRRRLGRCRQSWASSGLHVTVPFFSHSVQVAGACLRAHC